VRNRQSGQLDGVAAGKACIGGLRLRERELGIDAGEGVQVAGGNALEIGLRQLGGRYLLVFQLG
jgi:hypothetical protein